MSNRVAVLAVIMGVRAGEMHCLNYIDLPPGESGEEEVAEFVLQTVRDYEMMQVPIQFSFDEFIERALMEKYGK